MEICTRPTMGSDFTSDVCPSCGHNPLAHPGFANRGDAEIKGCLVCELKYLIEGYNGWLKDRMEL